MRCGVAIEQLNQHKSPPRTSEKTRKWSRKTADPTVRDRSDRSLWAVRPVGLDLKFQTGQTGCSDRSDRFLRPVRPLLPRTEFQPANSRWFQDYSFKSSPNGLKICREVPGIETNLSTKGINPKRKGSQEFRGGKEVKEGFPKTSKTSIRGTRDSRGFSSRLDGREANHGVPKPTKRKL